MHWPASLFITGRMIVDIVGSVGQLMGCYPGCHPKPPFSENHLN
jgi:hypothetical protein